MGFRAIARVAAAGTLLVAAGGRAADDAPPRIREVEVRRQDVFSEEQAARDFIPYGVANALHATTREGFVRRELLFRVGDPLDPAILAETERLLRTLRTFRSVEIRTEGEKVVVETADTWTLLPRLVVSRKGGVTTWAVGLDDNNFLGTGRQLSFRYDKGADRTQRSFAFVDPNGLAPHTSLSLTASDLSDGSVLAFGVDRPFYAIDAPWSASASFRYSRFDTHLWAGGEEESIWIERDRGAMLEGGRVVSLAGDRAHRLLASIEWKSTTLLPATLGPPPPSDPRDFLWLLGGYETEGRRWLKVREADRMGRDEDFNLAPFLRIQAGGSPRVAGADAAALVRVDASAGTVTPGGFALLTVSAESRYQDGPRAALLAADLRGYVLRPPFTVVGRIAVRAGSRLDPEDRLELDGANGLRGYRLHAVNGTRNLVLNLEARRQVLPEVLHLFSLGVAAFADAGFSGGPPDGTRRLADAGVGLRIGLARASKHDVLRLDLARSFHPDPLGRTGWLFSFSSSRAF